MCKFISVPLGVLIKMENVHRTLGTEANTRKTYEGGDSVGGTDSKTRLSVHQAEAGSRERREN